MAKKTTTNDKKILEAIQTLREAGLLASDILPATDLPQRGYSLTDAAGALGVTYRTALSYIKEGKLKAHKVGGKWTIDRADLETFIKQGK